MAFFTLDFGMLAQQFEICFIVVKTDRFPVFFLVALRAICTQPAFMLVVLLVAGVANGRCFTEFLRRQVTIFALYFGIQMPTLQWEIGLSVIKLCGGKYHDLGIAAFMLCMAFLAVFLFFHVAMKAAHRGNIFCHILVAILAQRILCGFIEFLVAFGALAFDLGMTLYQLAGR